MTAKFPRLPILALLVFLLRDATAQQGLGNVDFQVYTPLPSAVTGLPLNGLGQVLNVGGVVLSCYGDTSGQLLPCPYSYILEGIDNLTDPEIQYEINAFTLSPLQENGGHQHTNTLATYPHPYYYAAPQQLPIQVVGGTFTQSTPGIVDGNTDFDVAFLTYYTPEAAGAVWEEVFMQTPPSPP